MEHNYFLQRNGNSQGPYKLNILKKLVIQGDDLVWRNDMEDWAIASELIELSDLFTVESSLKINEHLTDTKLYYFVKQKSVKKGPYKLAELRKLTIFFDELIWRSDADEWRNAVDFEELKDIVIINPPPTPKEKGIAEINKKFISKIIIRIVLTYFIFSTLIGFISFALSQTSWERYLKETNGKYIPERQPKLEEGRGPLISDDEFNKIINDPKSTVFDELKAYSDHGDFRRHDNNFITLEELDDNRRYPKYIPNTNNESLNSYGQSFWFLPFKAFGSTIYLTSDEQNNSKLLLWHLILSSFASLSFIFLIFGGIYYFVKRSNIEQKPNTASV